MVRPITVFGIDVEVIRKTGVRTVKLKIDRKTGRPQVIIPFLYPVFMAQKFVESHFVWLQAQLKLTPAKTCFSDGMTLCILGRTLCIKHEENRRGGAFIEGDCLIVTGNAEHLHRRVKDFIKKQVADYAVVKAKDTARLLNKSVTRVTIKDTVSRWGSCTSEGHLAFCWRLGLAPLYVLDYVIIHEAAHLAEMNHSRAFWKKVAELNADTRHAKKWLNDHAAELHSFL